MTIVDRRARRYRDAEARLWASLDARPTERSIHLEGLGVTVRVQELDGGAPVLFIHGANTSGISWATLAARLDGRRRLLVDRPGTGLSDPLRPALDLARLPAFGDAFAIDVLDALGVARADLVATSFGGYLALRAAAAHPDRIRRLALLGWSAGAPVPRVPAFMRAMTLPLVGRLAGAVPPNRRSVGAMFRGIGHGPALDDGRITPLDLETYLALLRETDTLRNELETGRAFVSLRHGLDGVALRSELLRRVTAPTLLLWGDRDPFGGEAVARSFAASLPNAELRVMRGVGHAPWLDDLEGCVRALSAFLDGH